ncbi:MAG TPA: lipoprotein signal peptidase [Chitinophagales bacterium]|nr:lipoprotein signal peptidase [Chitinophagales bacterium]
MKQNKVKDNPVKKSYLAIGIILLVLLIDQIVKFWIKTTFALGEGFDILGFSWAKIHFVENEGMAFGMELGGDYGKLALSLFRLIAVFFIGYYLYTLIKSKAGNGLIISIALVFAGAMGNIIDSVFYGVIFSASTFGQVAEFMPEAGGYTTLLHGHVVDMFYFPMAQGNYPDWMPFLGGKYFLFFRPVFNIADSAITIGVLSILIFQRSIFVNSDSDQKPATENTTPVEIQEPLAEEEQPKT